MRVCTWRWKSAQNLSIMQVPTSILWNTCRKLL